MKNLKVWQKLALLGLLFLIPFAVVTYKLVSSVRQLSIEPAQKEIAGVEYILRLLTLLKEVQEQRGIANLALSEKGKYVEELDKSILEVEAAIRGVDDIEKTHGITLQTTEAWPSLRGEVHELISKVKNVPMDESYERHSNIIAQAVKLIGYVGDTSTLTLDPDVDSYYMMSILQWEAPKLAVRLAEARGAGGRFLTEPEPNKAKWMAELHKNAVVSEFLLGSLEGSFDKAFGANSALRSTVEASEKGNRASVAESLKTVQKLQANPDVKVDPADYFYAVNQGVESIFKMEKNVASGLTDLLNKRIDRYHGEVVRTLAFALLGLFVVLIIGYFIMRDITRPLNEVVSVANQIAAGNLAVQTSIGARRDELGDLSSSFNKMTVTLRDMAHHVEEIASGNLTVKVKAQSGRDVMGNALTVMVDRLSALAGQVQKSSGQVNTSIQDIAATSKEQQATASEIAATTTEIGATSKEISATSKELAKTMNEVAKVAEETARMAGSSQDALVRMEETMRHITEAAGAISSKLSVLNEKAGNINQVVTTITKVADQTNLLSLNAAIEAEKAGEYGRGFAVVATEIRRLADQTAVATYDIEQIVKEMQSAVSAGVMGMDKFSEEVRRGVADVQQVSKQLVTIIEQVQALTPQFESVTDGMQSQSVGAQQISEALLQLTESAQQTVESLRLSNQTIDQLRDAAGGMQSSISRFKV